MGANGAPPARGRDSGTVIRRRGPWTRAGPNTRGGAGTAEVAARGEVAAPDSAPPDLAPVGRTRAVSVVVPTYREATNIPALAGRVHASLSGAGVEWELILADDDSRDGSDAVAAELARSLPVRLVTRRDPPRDLSRSVLFGIGFARFDRLVVIDGEHPRAVRKPDAPAARDSRRNAGRLRGAAPDPHRRGSAAARAPRRRELLPGAVGRLRLGRRGLLRGGGRVVRQGARAQRRARSGWAAGGPGSKAPGVRQDPMADL